jgi:hypothetical protein
MGKELLFYKSVICNKKFQEKILSPEYRSGSGRVNFKMGGSLRK